MLTPQPMQKVAVVDILENPAVTQVLVVAVAVEVQEMEVVVLVGQDILLGTLVAMELMITKALGGAAVQ
tara:strand:- start:569 stop:775 length:207 start_codon:yes stop_codon:yes gene_type:complete